MPSDLWVPATDVIPPMLADQVAVGWVQNTTDQVWEYSAEIFYKKMTDLIEYRAGSTFFNPNDWQTRVETGGIGWAYGLELFIQKKLGKMTGWIGYTLSWNNRQFENLNNGNVYPYRFDRRHDISFINTYQISKNFDIAFSWVYGTGLATNIPIFETAVPTEGIHQGGTATHYGDLNSFRFAPYHRGDISFNWHKKKKRHERTWNVSIYNFYNRQNPFFIFRDTDNSGQPVLRQVSLFPILPSVSYRIKF